MRLPRLRLPRRSGAGARPKGGRLIGGRIVLLYVGYTVLLFFVFLVLTFPHEVLIRRALSMVNQGDVALEFNSAAFAWYRGYELAGVRLGPTDANNAQPPVLECSRLWVRPALGALVRGNPYALVLDADLYGGQAHGEASVADGRVVATLQLREVSLNRYRPLSQLLEEGQLTGRVSGDLAFEGRMAGLSAGQGTGEIDLDGGGIQNAKISGFGAFPDLHFRKSTLKFVLRNGRFELQDFTASGEELNVQASGQIVLRDPMRDSVLNLRATVQPSLATPDTVKTLLAMIPRTPGSKPDAPMTVTGTLSRPRVR